MHLDVKRVVPVFRPGSDVWLMVCRSFLAVWLCICEWRTGRRMLTQSTKVKTRARPLRLASCQTDDAAAHETPLAVQWYVLHTRSRQEKTLASELVEAGTECFLPLNRHTRRYGNRRVASDVPLFPGYVFINGTIEDACEADRTGRVARIIHVNDQKRLTRELEALRRVLSTTNHVERADYLTRGRRVEVRSGPLRGMRGIVQQSSAGRRIVIRIKELGLAASVEIDAAELEAIR